MEDTFTAEHFRPHIGKLVRFAAIRDPLTIDSVEGGGEPPKGWPRAPFVVIFRGPPGRDALVPEGAYDCEIEGGPTLNIYVMPIHTPAPGRQDYQAAFS
ncbi:MAG: hypothetical protein WDN03_17080 [Rhizomicrobium sp.]